VALHTATQFHFRNIFAKTLHVFLASIEDVHLHSLFLANSLSWVALIRAAKNSGLQKLLWHLIWASEQNRLCAFRRTLGQERFTIRPKTLDSRLYRGFSTTNSQDPLGASHKTFRNLTKLRQLLIVACKTSQSILEVLAILTHVNYVFDAR
jgi:hypothetical protein